MDKDGTLKTDEEHNFVFKIRTYNNKEKLYPMGPVYREEGRLTLPIKWSKSIKDQPVWEDFDEEIDRKLYDIDANNTWFHERKQITERELLLNDNYVIKVGGGGLIGYKIQIGLVPVSLLYKLIPQAKVFLM